MAQIKKDTSLRKAILQAAITGQLISNVEGTTETGKQLLDRIIEERNNKLLADWEEKQTDLFASNDAHSKNAKTVRSEQIRLLKKAKKPAPVVASEIDEEEIPFEIPENWCWCRLGDICLVKGGKRIPAGCTLTDIDTGHKYIRVADMKNGSVIVNNVKYITDEIHEKIKAYKISKDDVYITVAGTIGDSGIIPDELDNANLTENADKLVLFNGINKYCLHFFLSSGFFQEQISDAITKVGQPKLAIIRIQNFLLPLPPLAVQNAIVETLEQVLPLVDAYENALLQKEELKSALPDKIKKAILQEAITGQLTENWRKSATIKESGKQLLDRIIEERNAKALAEWEEALKKNVGGKATLPSFASKTRAKKPVPVVASEIEEEEIPFEVPESWCLCHLGEICNEIKRGKSPKYVDRSDYLAFAQKCNVKTGGIDLSLALYLDEKSIDRYSEEDNLIQGDVVINSTGGGTMGRVGYYETKVPEGIKGVYPDSHVTVIRSVGNINQRYLYYILKHNQPVLEDCGTGSTNQTELKPAVLANFVIPLPPLEEQEEIVKKVEELLPLCK